MARGKGWAFVTKFLAEGKGGGCGFAEKRKHCAIWEQIASQSADWLAMTGFFDSLGKGVRCAHPFPVLYSPLSR